MKAKRKRHEPEFKAKVGLAALKGMTTIQQIAKEFDVHPVQVSDWKKTLAQGLPALFGAGKAASSTAEDERQLAQLHANIGQLAMEVDFLTKKSRQLGL